MPIRLTSQCDYTTFPQILQYQSDRFYLFNPTDFGFLIRQILSIPLPGHKTRAAQKRGSVFLLGLFFLSGKLPVAFQALGGVVFRGGEELLGVRGELADKGGVAVLALYELLIAGGGRL